MLVLLPLQIEDDTAVGVILLGKTCTKIVLVALTAPHGPAGSLVSNVRTTEPLKLAAAV